MPNYSTTLGTNTYNDLIIFDSATVSYMPTDVITLSNKWSGGVWQIPQLYVKNGTINLSGNSASKQIWAWGDDATTTTLTVGDGTGAAAVVNAQFADWSRDKRGSGTVFKFLINSDGTLNNDRNVATWGESSIPVQVTINGGTVDISGTINAGFTNLSTSYVSFTDVGSTFTANLGGQLPDLTTIQGQLGNSFRLGGALASNPNASLVATDNLDGSFTVSVAIPEPASLAVLAWGGLMVMFPARRRA
ncbi:MAG: hypothetical protein GC164_06260 [Phycisphaera sp.]|nr:hypothetical protein [Phycisphaera sp.]